MLATSDANIDGPLVRDLLGLAPDAAIDGFVDALAEGDALAGIDILDRLEAEGRDVIAFAEQVVTRLRERLVAAMQDRDGAAQRSSLAAAARRLTGIDASRSGLGGYRWQLELALLANVPTGATAIAAPTPPTRAPVVPARPPVVAPTAPSKDPPMAAAGPAPAPIAAEAPPPARAAVTAPPPATGDLLGDILTSWPAIVAWVGRNPLNKPLIASCRPVEVRDGVLILGFPEDQPFLREKAEARRSAFEDGVAHVLGRPVGVRCVVANVELADATKDEGPDLVAQARKVFGGELADIGDIG